jgi:hypothetical protein
LPESYFLLIFCVNKESYFQIFNVANMKLTDFRYFTTNCSAAFNTIVDCQSIQGYTREFSNLSSAGLKRSLVLLLRNPPARFPIPAVIEARVELNSSAMIL